MRAFVLDGQTVLAGGLPRGQARDGAAGRRARRGRAAAGRAVVRAGGRAGSLRRIADPKPARGQPGCRAPGGPARRALLARRVRTPGRRGPRWPPSSASPAGCSGAASVVSRVRMATSIAGGLRTAGKCWCTTSHPTATRRARRCLPTRTRWLRPGLGSSPSSSREPARRTSRSSSAPTITPPIPRSAACATDSPRSSRDADVRVSSLSEYLAAAAEHAAMAPRLDGELRWSYGYTWTLQGVHGTRAPLKRLHAEAELTLERVAEPLAALARWRSRPGRSPAASPRLAHAAPLAVSRLDRWLHLGRLSPRGSRRAWRTRERWHETWRAPRSMRSSGNDPDTARDLPAATAPRLVLYNPVPRRRRAVVVVADLTWFRRDVLVGPPGGRTPRRAAAPPRPMSAAALGGLPLPGPGPAAGQRATRLVPITIPTRTRSSRPRGPARAEAGGLRARSHRWPPRAARKAGDAGAGGCSATPILAAEARRRADPVDRPPNRRAPRTTAHVGDRRTTRATPTATRPARGTA